MDIKQLAAQSIEQVKVAAQQYSRLKGWNLASLKGLIRTTKVVVKHVQDIGLLHGLANADKQALAVELMMHFKPWWVPEKWARAILPDLIDLVVDALKDKFPK